MSALVDPALALLCARRIASPGVALVLALAAAAVALPGAEPPGTSALAVAGALPPEAAAAALARQRILGAMIALVATLAIHRCARIAAAWRGGEAGWARATPGSPATFLASAWIAALGVLAAALAGVGALAELALEDERPWPRAVRAVPAPPALVVPGDPPKRWLLEDPGDELAPGTVLRFTLVAAPALGPAAETRVRVARAGEPALATEARARVGGRARLDVAVPEGAGDLVLELAVGGDGAAVLLARDAIRALAPGGTAAEASRALLARAFVALALASALALALGTWLAPAIAGFATLAAWVACALAGGPLERLPGVGLLDALREVGEGVVPRALAPASAFAPAAALVGAALAVGLLGWRARRRGR